MELRTKEWVGKVESQSLYAVLPLIEAFLEFCPVLSNCTPSMLLMEKALSELPDVVARIRPLIFFVPGLSQYWLWDETGYISVARGEAFSAVIAVLEANTAFLAVLELATAVIATEDDTTALSAVELAITAAIATEDDTTALSAVELAITAAIAT